MLIYGAGSHLNDMLAWYPSLAGKIERIFDKDENKVGMTVAGKVVESADSLKELEVGTQIIISAIKYYDEIDREIHGINKGLLCVNIDDTVGVIKADGSAPKANSILEQKVIMFGVGRDMQQAVNKFPAMLEEILVFADNFKTVAPPQRTDKLVEVDDSCWKPVVRPESIKCYVYDKLVIATSRFYKPIKEQCLALGIPKQKIISLKEYILDLLIRGRCTPTKVWIDVSTHCQLNCSACYMRHNTERVTSTLGFGNCRFADFKKFLDDNPRIHLIEISNNGEPFLNPELADILRYAHARQVSIMIRNGANFNYVTDEVAELLVKTQVKYISISLDGATQETYAKYRRNGQMDQVIANIRKVNEFKKKYHSRYPVLAWKFILMNHNQHEVAKAKEMAHELGMEIVYRRTWETGFKVVEDPAWLQKVTGMHFIDNASLEQKTQKSFNYSVCLQPFFEPCINWDGRLLGCCMAWRENFHINVFKEGLSKALASDIMVNARRMMLGEEMPRYMETPCIVCSNYKKMRDFGYHITKRELLERLGREYHIERLLNRYKE